MTAATAEQNHGRLCMWLPRQASAEAQAPVQVLLWQKF
jgi:hypothetical protein